MLLKALAAKLRASDIKRFQLRGALMHKEPRLTPLTLPAYTPSPHFGQAPSIVEVAAYNYVTRTEANPVSTESRAPASATRFTGQHTAVVVPKYTHPKKHTMRPIR